MTGTDHKVNSFQELDNVLSTAESAIEELEKIRNMDISEEEKIKMSEVYQEQLKEFSSLYESIFDTIKSRSKKGEKVSYYTLSEQIRKHRNFIYSLTGMTEHSVVENASDQMYDIVKEIMECDEPLKKTRLGQLYTIALKKNLTSFKENTIEIYEKTVDDENRDDVIADFYAMYCTTIVQAVTDRFNSEIEERIKAQEELEEKRRIKENTMETGNDVVKETKTETAGE